MDEIDHLRRKDEGPQNAHERDGLPSGSNFELPRGIRRKAGRATHIVSTDGGREQRIGHVHGSGAPCS
jgi:hypothetical protein